MTMAPGLRKLALTAHVTASVGWLGAVAASLALGVAGLTLQGPERVRAIYLALEPMGWYVLVPASVTSLLTGLIQSLGTRWGLFRHYWIVAKFLINAFATLVVIMYMQTLGYLADAAAATSDGDLGALRSPSVVIHAAGALALLLLATALSVYKPRGVTRYGQRRQQEERRRPDADGAAAARPAVAPRALQ